jgi:hypothetical protein
MEIIIDSYRVKNCSLHVILHVKKYLDYYVDGRFENSILCLPDGRINKSENETGAPSILNEDYCCSGWPVMIDLAWNHFSFDLERAPCRGRFIPNPRCGNRIEYPRSPGIDFETS